MLMLISRISRCIPNCILIPYSMVFLYYSVPKKKKSNVNTRMMHVNNQKNKVWSVGHFMHSTVAALIMFQRGGGYQTLIVNDKITLYNSYTTQLST